jgi:predicted dehydrogenase
MILIGVIGTGRQGIVDMQEMIYRGLEYGARVVAVCDVDRHRVEDAQWLAEKIYAAELGRASYKGVAAFSDFRELLARPDIDGVMIVTPDHWHAVLGTAAAEAGKDVYLEKPFANTIADGRRLVEAVRRRRRILQVGSQLRSSVYFRLACEAARNRRIGEVRSIRVWLPEDVGTGDPAEMPVPRNLDYDLWLGPAPRAPFSQDRVHPQLSYERPGWMQIEPYCRGIITNWGAHMNDIVQWGKGSEDTGPVEIDAQAEFPDRGLFNVHTKFQAQAVYADGVRLLIETGEPSGVRFEGDHGWIFITQDELKASDPAVLKKDAGEGEVRLYRSDNHMRNFLECVRDRRDPVAPAEAGHRSNTVCLLAHIAMRLGRKLRWDPGAERFLNDDEANGWLDSPRREPWTA